MNLVIVESPTKARKLAIFLGKEYTIEASVGHVRDLPKSTMGVDTKKDFEPVYEISEEKKKVVATLRKKAHSAQQIFLATDPDREGEAIAWHIQYLLSHDDKGRKMKVTDTHFHRATFHEITKQAVLQAIEHPKKVNMDLVDAQQARRVVDRLVGYSLSPVLWKKVRRGLSAGRVQSVALRLIVDREREIEAFRPDEYWEVDVLLSSDQMSNELRSTKFRIKNAKNVDEFSKNLPETVFVARVFELDGKKYLPTKEVHVIDVVRELENAKYTVHSVESKERRRASLPPFSTSLLQQAAANRLGFSGKQTMSLAQQLYEEGLITYHRTDSFQLSTQAIQMAREYISKKFGSEYLPTQPRVFASKSKNAQEAHEAIRITDVTLNPDDIHSHSPRFNSSHVKLYDLIYRRFIASQMESAVYDSTTILVSAQKSHVYTLKSTGSVLKFDGWMRLFPNQGDTLLPKLQKDQDLGYIDQLAAQKFTQPPPRYNDASLIKVLEEKGIGRPSTYASIISVIVERGYIERKEKRFFATAVGKTVSDFLLEHFPEVMDYDFTAEMEEDLDRIARGEKEWKKVVKSFFTPLEKKIEAVTQNAQRAAIPVEETGEPCPECGSTHQGMVVIRAGRFGKFKSCNRFPDCKYTHAIVEKLEGVHCPVCTEGEIIIKNSRWGKAFYGCSRYPDCDWASWSKPEPGLSLSKAVWEKMKEERRERMEKRKATLQAKNSGASAKKKTSKKAKKKRVKKKKT